MGLAIRDFDREKLVISTKKSMTRKGERLSGDGMIRGLEASLERLGTDYVDVYHLHALMAPDYDYAVSEIVPALESAREAGKLRFIGVTEMFGRDCGHEMLARSLADDCWDVCMAGLNVLNHSAARRVFSAGRGTIERDVGVLIMFALRRALSRPVRLREVVADLVEESLV